MAYHAAAAAAVRKPKHNSPSQLMLHSLAGTFTGASADEQALRTKGEWQEFLRAVHHEGVRPQPELVEVAAAVSLPVSLAQIEEAIARGHEPVGKVEASLTDAAARVRHLHALLAEWRLAELSDEQTRRLLALVEAVHAQLGASTGRLRAYHLSIDQHLGPEMAQSLFWDRVDVASGGRPAPHSFQREHLGLIEQRCAQRRARAPHVAPAALQAEIDAASNRVALLPGRCTEVRRASARLGRWLRASARARERERCGTARRDAALIVTPHHTHARTPCAYTRSCGRLTPTPARASLACSYGGWNRPQAWGASLGAARATRLRLGGALRPLPERRRHAPARALAACAHPLRHAAGAAVRSGRVALVPGASEQHQPQSR